MVILGNQREGNLSTEIPKKGSLGLEIQVINEEIRINKGIRGFNRGRLSKIKTQKKRLCRVETQILRNRFGIPSGEERCTVQLG